MRYVSHRNNILAELRHNFRDAAILLANEATKEMTMPQLWEGFNDIRDIVDLGQLRAAQHIDIDTSGVILSCEIKYQTEYAQAVHDGATIRYSNGNTRVIPPRPWVAKAAARLPLPKLITDLG